jgi:replicative DNA helicase
MVNQQQMTTDPGAPLSLEAEEAVLGSILLDPPQFLTLITFLKAEDFFMLRHTYIWQAFERVHARKEPIDHITIAEELENMQVLETIGGRAYLMQLVNNQGTSYYAEVYGHLVERTAIRRRLMIYADTVKKLAQDESLNIEHVIGEVEASLNSVTMGVSVIRDAVPMWDAADEHYQTMELRLNNSMPQGVPCGFRDIDALLNGYPRGALSIIAARPSMGKTALVLCMLANMARLGIRSLFFSIEMATQRLLDRLVSIETGINLTKIINGALSPQETARYTEAIGRMSQWLAFFDDTSAPTPESLRTKAQRLKYQHGLDVIFVDYLQIMSTTKNFSNEEARVSYLSRQCKVLAKDLNVPLISLAQLSRDVENRKDKRPMLSDLRSSGQIEQDADVVQFIYRDDYYNEATEFPNQAEIITAKNRDGATGTTSLYFEKTLTKFMDASVHRVDLSDLG